MSTSPACAWPSCANKHHSRGLCSAHYKRVQAHIRKHNASWPTTPTLMANVTRACGAWAPEEAKEESSICRWPGCDRDKAWMGYCARDYQQALRHLPSRKRGDPITPAMHAIAVAAWGKKVNPTPSADVKAALAKLKPVPSVISSSALLCRAMPEGAFPPGIPVITPKPARAELELLVLEAIAEGTAEVPLREAMALAARIARRLTEQDAA